MNAQEVIEKFCLLQAAALEHIGFDNSADCFCGKAGFWHCEGYGGTFEEGYRNNGAAIEFIRQALIEKIAREKSGQSTKGE